MNNPAVLANLLGVSAYPAVWVGYRHPKQNVFLAANAISSLIFGAAFWILFGDECARAEKR
jgi:hypothetical protein